MDKAKEYFGYGSVERLTSVIKKVRPHKVFLITGRESYCLCKAENVLSRILRGINTVVFNDFSANPKLGDVKKGISLYLKNNPDIMVAVGGGSVIDMAKLVNIFAAQNEEVVRYLNGAAKISRKPKPLIAIPTTAGSGSEATHFAVLYSGKTKYSVAHRYILPCIAVIDPQFTLRLPSYITAASGMDAFSHAVESYWSINSSNASKKYAKKVIELVLKNLPKAVNSPNKLCRKNMSLAAHLAGKAINITKTTACHAISYPLTSYFNISHGHAVAQTLGSMFVYNSKVTDADVVDKRGADYVRKSITKLVSYLGCKNAYEAKDEIGNLMQQIGLRTRLSELGLRKESDIELILKDVNAERLSNNPRTVTKQAIRDMLKNIF